MKGGEREARAGNSRDGGGGTKSGVLRAAKRVIREEEGYYSETVSYLKDETSRKGWKASVSSAR